MSRQTFVILIAGLVLLASLFVFITRDRHQAHPEAITTSTTGAAGIPAKAKPSQSDIGSSEKTSGTDTGKGENSQYERAENLLPMIAALEERSDLVALTLTARALEECRLLAVSPNYFAAVDTNGAELYGDKLPIVKSYVARYLARCGDLAQFKKPRTAETRDAISRAAAAGSPWARAQRFDSMSRHLDADQADAEMEYIMRSRDANAVGALADAMAVPRINSKYADLSGTPLHAYAWQLVSCDLGRDCSSDGALMRQTCILGGTCGASTDYRALLQQSVLSADDFLRVQQIEQSILSVVRGAN